MTLVPDRFGDVPQTHQASEINDEDVEYGGDFSSIDPLQNQNRIVTYPNPNGKPFAFEVRSLTAMEFTQLEKHAIPDSVIRKALQDGKTDEEIDNLPEVADKEYEARVKAVVMGCVRPVLTKEQVEKFPNDLLLRLTAAIRLGGKPNAIDTFPKVDSDQ